MLAGYQVFLFPLIDMLEGAALSRRILPTAAFRLVTRSALVIFIGFVACAVPFFSAILGILGALSVTPTTFMMPCILWLHLGPGGRGRGWGERERGCVEKAPRSATITHFAPSLGALHSCVCGVCRGVGREREEVGGVVNIPD